MISKDLFLNFGGTMLNIHFNFDYDFWSYWFSAFLLKTDSLSAFVLSESCISGVLKPLTPEVLSYLFFCIFLGCVPAQW